MIKVLLVDDHELVRTGVRSILEGTTDIRVVAEAASGEEALDMVKEYRLDVVLMDVNMPGIGGIEATRRILRALPEQNVIALTVHDAQPFPDQVLAAGARGYLTKGGPADEMLAAIREVARGKRHMSAMVASNIAMSPRLRDAGGPFGALSQREMQVLLMVAGGQGTQDISDALCLSPKTISTYRYRLYEKLDVKNDVQLAHLAARHGLLGEGDQ